ncbi:hypothetical protein KO533_04660 [Shewanella sp. NKUCC05_KAH]|uniref:hypothetical protein n=1 Tax=Shewanella sp. NKUCC05_KAH TaxID=2842126 RepID=UPI001C5A933B|nr:hypothetical protein [Shewanella sp. NKUCC05_KAH]MBW3525863.1 hypothetical protein [Shewanella sp. NKUCC05_KAH]
MHSISPYLLRSFNKELPGPPNKKYAILDKIGAHDTFSLLRKFIESKSNGFEIREASKQVYRFQDMVYDDSKRMIHGWFQVGVYGIKANVIDTETGNVDFAKAQKHAEIIQHYIQFFIPKGYNEAIAIMHSYRNVGVKTLFSQIFFPYFMGNTTLTLQMNPLSYDKALASWQEANAKEIKVTKFKGITDVADQMTALGHFEFETILKPKRNGTFGKFKEFFKKGSDQANAVELLSSMGEQVKTVVEINDKRRTFNMGVARASSLCEIELDENVVLIDGNPDFASMNGWCTSIIKEYAESMYPGLSINL